MRYGHSWEKIHVMQECQQCGRLRLAASEASRAYHALEAELESAHIAHQNDRTIYLRPLVDRALLKRDAAIDELSTHERTHLRTKSVGA